MKAGTTIRKIFFIAVWVAIGGGMFTLLLAAISKKNKGHCRDYSISMEGDQSLQFMTGEDIAVLLEDFMGGPVKGQPIASFHLRELENKLERNSWIGHAELYFDNRDILHVSIREKSPVARIFTVSGRSFYIDSLGGSMPLSDKKSARVPVFTGFPEKSRLSAKDSLLLGEIAATASFIIRDPFWNAQVSQIDILADRSFEMIPVVGDHRVKLGGGDGIGSKFKRLYIFYQQVLKNTGFNSYKLIDVQYRGQVIASRRWGQGKIDSVQLRKNIEKLLNQAKQASTDTVARIRPLPQKPVLPDEKPIAKPILPLDNQNPGPNPVKTTSVSPAGEKGTGDGKKVKEKEAGTGEEKRVPKAVMPSRKQTGAESGNQ